MTISSDRRPRYLILPNGAVKTSFPATQAVCRQIGIEFDPWQVELNRAILAKDIQDQYAADIAVVSICRQAGKTFDVGALVFADSIINPGTTTVWTAHRFKVARETFNSMRALAMSDLLKPHLDYRAITTGAGTEAIPFYNGSRIVFGARERGSIRGFSNVRRLVLDEGQILSESTMADLAPIMNQGDNPQMIIMGTPPKPGDPGEIFAGFREQAISGQTEGLLYVEYSAEPGSDPDDWDAIAQANPSFPDRTGKRAILRLRRALTLEDFMREAMGMWSLAADPGVLPRASWKKQGDPESLAVSNLAFGVEVGPDLAWASISLAGKRSDGAWHIELEERRDGVMWLGPYLTALLKLNPIPVAVDVAGPISALLEKKSTGRRPRWTFKDWPIKVHAVTVQELGTGCSLLLNGVVTGTLWHTSQPQMDAAARVAGKRNLGDTGMWVFARKGAGTDITPIQSAVLALIGAQTAKAARPPRPSRGASIGSRRAVVLSG
jgi:hypothetical protein